MKGWRAAALILSLVGALCFANSAEAKKTKISEVETQQVEFVSTTGDCTITLSDGNEVELNSDNGWDYKMMALASGLEIQSVSSGTWSGSIAEGLVTVVAEEGPTSLQRDSVEWVANELGGFPIVPIVILVCVGVAAVIVVVRKV